MANNKDAYKFNPSMLDGKKECSRVIPGWSTNSRFALFDAIANYIRDHDIGLDIYGQSDFITDFEGRAADLLGQEAAVVMPTGTMAQLIAARIYCDRSGATNIAMHPTCHVYKREQDAYDILHNLNAQLIGVESRTFSTEDLAGVSDASFLIYELPMRELGGDAPPTIEVLDEHINLIRKQGAHAHLDGARLLEICPHFGVSPTEIGARFDSVYLSLYKGLGGIAGAVLAGDGGFIEQARAWRKRHGGDLWQFAPIVASALPGLERWRENMPRRRLDAQRLAGLLLAFPEVTIRPAVPLCNMFHVEFDAAAEDLYTARDQVASELGVWTFNYFKPLEGADRARTEMTIYEGLVDFPERDLEQALNLFVEKMRLFSHERSSARPS